MRIEEKALILPTLYIINKEGSVSMTELIRELTSFFDPDDGFESYIDEAIKKVKPVCPNCHRMIHRDVKKPLSISELKNRLK